jgi:hypothetical protein
MNMRGSRGVLLATVVLAVTLSAPAVSLAAGPLADGWSSISLRLDRLDGSGAPVLLVMGDLRAEIRQPVDVALPVPPGSKVIWSGEIVDADAKGDIRQPFQTAPGNGFDSISVPLKSSRRAQVDVELPGAIEVGGDGVKTARIDWVAAAPVQAVQRPGRLDAGHIIGWSQADDRR